MGNSRFGYWVAGAMLAYGVYSLRQGIRTRKASDTVIGIACLLAVAALVFLRVRNR